jgi:hypothetical protein
MFEDITKYMNWLREKYKIKIVLTRAPEMQSHIFCNGPIVIDYLENFD